MANDSERGRAPTHDLNFIVPGGRDGADRWVEVAPAWTSDKGAVSFELHTVPVALLAGRPVRFVLVARKPRGSR
jgi:hypothetical protein